MTLWKRAAFYAFGWVAKIVATLWLRTCRISEYGRGMRKIDASFPGIAGRCEIDYVPLFKALCHLDTGCLKYPTPGISIAC